MAEDFRREHPEDFDVLRRVPITYEKEHHDVHRKYRRPLFDVDLDDRLTGVYFSPQFEGTLDVDQSLVRPFYQGYAKWHAHIRKPEYVKTSKLEEGQIITFNNRRVLHGRKGFPANESRLLMGTYSSLDDMSNRIRVLARENQQPVHVRRLGNHCH